MTVQMWKAMMVAVLLTSACGLGDSLRGGNSNVAANEGPVGGASADDSNNDSTSDGWTPNLTTDPGTDVGTDPVDITPTLQ